MDNIVMPRKMHECLTKMFMRKLINQELGSLSDKERASILEFTNLESNVKAEVKLKVKAEVNDRIKPIKAKCKSGKRCYNPRCDYEHPPTRNLDKNRLNAPICDAESNCDDKTCYLQHPKSESTE